MSLRLAFAALALTSSSLLAEEPRGTLRVMVLPTRSLERPELEALGQRVGALLAVRWKVSLEMAANHFPQESIRTRGQSVEQLTARLDRMIERQTREPHRANPSELVAAYVERASLALAGGDAARAEALLEQLLRYDPTFALLPSENGPRMVQAIDETRRALGPRPLLRVDDVGTACSDVTELVAVRSLGNEVELTRFSGCRKQAVVQQARNASEDAAVALLSSPTGAVPLGDTTSARARFEAGQGLYHQGRFEEAAREFAAGYQAEPRPEFLINLGQAHRALHRFRAARADYARFLAEAPADHPARANVEELLREIHDLPDEPVQAVSAAPAIEKPREAPHRSRRKVVIGVLVGAVVIAAGVAIGVGVGLAATSTPSLTIGHHTFPN